jgi:predicted nucleic-acid-binding protein
VTGIDTNVLVRYLTEDDAVQTESVHSLFRATRQSGEHLHISCVVLAETYWVLRFTYRMSKKDIVNGFRTVLEAELFEVESQDQVRASLDLCTTGKGEFTDVLIGQLNRARGCRETVTFDRGLRQVAGFRVL